MRQVVKQLLGLLALAPSLALPQVIPGFDESGQATTPSPSQSQTGYYMLPNGDLIGPDGRPIDPQLAGGGQKPIIQNPQGGQQRFSPAAQGGSRPTTQSQIGSGSDMFNSRLYREVNRKPQIEYNPDGTVLVRPLPDMMDPFSLSTESAFPLDPQETRNLKRIYNQSERAKSLPFHGEMPTPVTTQVVLDLSPNASPPVVRVIPGNGSVVTFRDISGAAWPIISYKTFNSNFNVSQPVEGSNMITVAATSNYDMGNVAVVLQGYSSPVILSTISTSAKQIDAKLDIQIPLMGPQAIRAPVVTTAPLKRDLIDALYGSLPDGAIPMEVAGANAKAWKTADGSMIITGALDVVTPRPIERTGTGDGYFAFRAPLTSVYFVTQNGTERKMVVREKAK